MGYIHGIHEVLNMLAAAEARCKKLKAIGIIVKGDFNARNTAWGDKVDNEYGKHLIEKLDYTKFSICTSKTPTFLSANGSSVIDLMIVSNNLAECTNTCETDAYVELYSGAPQRGHVPLISTISTGEPVPNNSVIEKISIENVVWENWSKDLDESVESDSNTLAGMEDPSQLWTYIHTTIQK